MSWIIWPNDQGGVMERYSAVLYCSAVAPAVLVVLMALFTMWCQTCLPCSQTGKKLMAKCRMLIQENQELGRQLSQGRIAQLEAELALQKKYSEELKSSQDGERNNFLHFYPFVGQKRKRNFMHSINSWFICNVLCLHQCFLGHPSVHPWDSRLSSISGTSG